MDVQDNDDESKSYLLLWMRFQKGMIRVPNSQSYFDQTVTQDSKVRIFL